MGIVTVDAVPAAEAQQALEGLLAEWRDQARRLWEITAEIGDILARQRKQIPPDDWAAWLQPLGLTPYVAFVFMNARQFPDLMAKHQPGSIEAVAKLLPSKGLEFEAAQAQIARDLKEAGKSMEYIRAHMLVPREAVRRWLDPDGHAKREATRDERRLLRLQAVADERERRRRAALKAKGGPVALAQNHIYAAASALDEAWRAAPNGGDRKRLLGAALDALYKAKDKTYSAEGIR